MAVWKRLLHVFLNNYNKHSIQIRIKATRSLTIQEPYNNLLKVLYSFLLGLLG
jgi:methylmalonyl-CoA mutase N-terminal domain/subunit